MDDLNEQLIDSAEIGDLISVKGLLEQGANINATRCSPMIFASDNGHTKVVELLLDQNATVHPDALYFACEKGHFKIVELLLKHGAKVTERDLHTAIKYNNTEIVKVLTSYPITFDTTATLVIACHSASLETIKLLVNSGFQLTKECIDSHWDSIQDSDTIEFIQERLPHNPL